MNNLLSLVCNLEAKIADGLAFLSLNILRTLVLRKIYIFYGLSKVRVAFKIILCLQRVERLL